MANTEIGFSIKVDGVERTVKSLDEMNQAIRDLTAEAAKADFGSKNFEEITGRIQKAKAAVKEFKNDTRTKEVKDQYTDLAGGISSSFDVAENSLKAFGVESKAVSSVSTSANAAITAALTLRQIAELKVDAAVALSDARTKVAAAGTYVYATAQKVLNAVMKANPIGLVITALTALTAGYFLIVKPVKAFIQSMGGLNAVLEKTIGIMRDVASVLTGGLIDDAATAKTAENSEKMVKALEDVNSAANRRITTQKQLLAQMEASGASDAAILKQKKKIIAEEIDLNRKVVLALLEEKKARGELSEEQVANLNKAAAKMKELKNQEIVDQNAYDKKVRDATKTKNEKIASDAKSARDKTNQDAETYRKEVLQKIKDSLIKERDLRQKANQDAIKDEQEKARVVLKDAQDNARAELDIEIKKINDKKVKTKEDEKYLIALGKQRVALVKSQEIETTNLLEEQAKVKLEKQREYDKGIKDIQDQTTLEGITNLRMKGLKTLQIERDNAIKEIEQSGLTDIQKLEKKKDLETLYRAKELTQRTEWAQEDIDKKIEANQAFIESESVDFEAKYNLLDQQQKLINEKTYQNESERVEALKKNSADIKKIQLAELEYNASITNAKLGLASQAASILQQIAGENKAVAIAGLVVEKAAAIGQIISATSIANAKSVASFPLTLGQPWVGINTASAALSIASTVAAAAKSIAEITSAGSGSGSSGGGEEKIQPSKFADGGYVTGPGSSRSDSIPAMLSNGESVINANSTQLFGGLLSAINVAGGGQAFDQRVQTQTGPAPIIKTYVVASDMTSQQEADKRIKDIARI